MNEMYYLAFPVCDWTDQTAYDAIIQNIIAMQPALIKKYRTTQNFWAVCDFCVTLSFLRPEGVFMEGEGKN
jgi:hypothetical protein